MAPDFHHVNAIFKRPRVMLRAGACFRVSDLPKPFYGTAITTERLLSPENMRVLEARGIRPTQAAFALAVPMKWPFSEMNRTELD